MSDGPKKEQDPPTDVRVADRLCELGGCCDVCWYRPDHPRFRKSAPDH